MSKVYLVNPPSPFLFDDKSNIPLGLMFVHSYMKQHDIDVQIIDLAGLKEEAWEIPDDGDIYGVTASTPQFPAAAKVATRLKRSGRMLVLGGVHGTCRPGESLLSDFDIVVKGEGELAMLALALGHKPGHIMGINYMHSGKIMDTGSPLTTRNIDRYPYPLLEALDIGSYKCGVYTTADGDAVSGIPIITARGCPHNCAFCCSPKLYGRKVRFHGIDYMDEWLAYLNAYGYRHFYVVDDTVLISLNRLSMLCEVLDKRSEGWRCCIRGDAATKEKMQLLAGSGCRQVDIGVETGSQRILDLVNKGETVQDNAKAIRLAHSVGIKVKACLIVGLPGETQKDIDLTKKFIRKQKPDSVTLCTFIPFPGCAIEQDPTKYGYNVNPATMWGQYFCCGAEPAKGVQVADDRAQTEDFRQQLLDVIGENTTLNALKKRKLDEDLR
jgi:anaerobic magnesium-protoporphyrin IX monomethyl ester cyclase